MGTFGELLTPEDKHLCYTIERPWEDNKSNISCIPNGKYTVRSYKSVKFGPSWILNGGTVDRFDNNNGQRWGILIHPANKPSQLAGCIAPVTSFVTIHSEWGGSRSRSAMRVLNTYLEHLLDTGEDRWTLNISTDTRGGI